MAPGLASHPRRDRACGRCRRGRVRVRARRRPGPRRRRRSAGRRRRCCRNRSCGLEHRHAGGGDDVLPSRARDGRTGRRCRNPAASRLPRARRSAIRSCCLPGGGRVLVLRNHCCAVPPSPVGVLTSNDGGVSFLPEQSLTGGAVSPVGMVDAVYGPGNSASWVDGGLRFQNAPLGGPPVTTSAALFPGPVASGGAVGIDGAIADHGRAGRRRRTQRPLVRRGPAELLGELGPRGADRDRRHRRPCPAHRQRAGSGAARLPRQRRRGRRDLRAQRDGRWPGAGARLTVRRRLRRLPGRRGPAARRVEAGRIPADLLALLGRRRRDVERGRHDPRQRRLDARRPARRGRGGRTGLGRLPQAQRRRRGRPARAGDRRRTASASASARPCHQRTARVAEHVPRGAVGFVRGLGVLDAARPRDIQPEHRRGACASPSSARPAAAGSAGAASRRPARGATARAAPAGCACEAASVAAGRPAPTASTSRGGWTGGACRPRATASWRPRRRPPSQAPRPARGSASAGRDADDRDECPRAGRRARPRRQARVPAERVLSS